MKHRLLTAGAMIVMMELALALSFPPLSRLSFAASQEFVTYQGGNKSASPCGASTYETCPSPTCTCLTSTGTASGALTGTGFATFNLIITDNVLNGCQAYNGAMFIIAPKDLEEVDFSGSVCDDRHRLSGNYVIAISQAGHSGSGTVSGTISKKLRFALTFH